MAIPLAGRIRIERGSPSGVDAGEMDWTKEPSKITEADTVWLSEFLRCPWPMPINGHANVEQDDITIGRASDCDIRIDRDSVSSRHARMRLDRHGRVILIDNHSRNGVYVDAALTERVNAVMLNPDMNVYLGSHAISGNRLIAEVKRLTKNHASEVDDQSMSPTPPPGQTGKPALGDPDTRRVSGGASRLSNPSDSARFWVGVFSLPALLVAFVIWIKPPRIPNVDISQNKSNLAQITTAVPKPDANSSVQPDSDSLPSLETLDRNSESGSSADVIAESLPVTVDPVDVAIYWIGVTHEATGAIFRVGTATAIGDTTLVTAGSVIGSLDELVQNGFSNPVVINVFSSEQISVRQRGVSEEYRDRAAKAMAVIEQHDAIVEGANRDEIPREQLRQQYETASRQVNLMLADLHAVDVGWLCVDELPSHLEIDVDAPFHPQMKLKAYHTALDGVDSMWSDQARYQVSEQEFRVVRQTAKVDKIAGVLQLTKPLANSLSSNSFNWAGVPVCVDGKLTAMLLAHQPTDSDGGQSSERMEWFAIVGSTIAQLCNRDHDSATVCDSTL
ncbi:FHA domain-containing protein [Rhodopirellula sallentina]|nr:FHA domain-containing protein [Rhodopirellula sallentina]